MRKASIWSALSIRGKINFILLPALVPLLIIAGITYNSHRTSLIEDSERIMMLVAQSQTDKINDFLAGQNDIYQQWIEEDIYGLGIEFETIKELGEQIDRLLLAATGFSLAVLTDGNGTILHSSVQEGCAGLNGRVVADVANFSDKPEGSLVFTNNGPPHGAGESSGCSYLWGFPTRNSSGEVNGYLLAYLNWNVIQSRIGLSGEMLQKNGFKHARMALVNTATSRTMAGNDPADESSNIEIASTLNQWLGNDANTGTSHEFDVEGTPTYVTFVPMTSAGQLTSGGEGSSELVLTAFVPERDILVGARAAARTTSILAAIAAVILILSIWLISRGIAKQLRVAIESLTASSSHVSVASTQLADSSQVMTNGANNQAALVQETSSSLLQITAQTKQNVENASQASNTTNEARNAASTGREAMNRMSTVIGEINESSNRTAKIISTIDEIAFQTNLLALNAAVEAARAGEAGKGFAVVAEEVRNLAQRSADAARETSTLIEESQRNAKNGVEVSNEVENILKQIDEGVQTGTELINEVHSASREQSEGVSQAQTAMSEIDKLTNTNVVTSEEVANSGQKLAALSSELDKVVSTLAFVVEGARSARSIQSARNAAPSARKKG